MNQSQTTPSTPAPSLYPPQPATLENCVADITALWYLAVKRGPKVEDDARAIFAKHPGARQDQDASRKAQEELRQLLDLQTCAEPSAASQLPPFGLDPVAQYLEVSPAPADIGLPSGEDVPSEGGEVEDTPADDVSLGSDISESGDAREEEEGDSDAEQEADPDHAEEEPAPADDVPDAPDGGSSTAWPEGALGEGLISGLAATLAVGDTVQLVLARTATGQILATVVPQRLNGELTSTCKELQSKGTPRQLDEEFLDAMGTYREVRQTAREAAEHMLSAAKAAAASAKTAASKAAEASKKKADEARATQQASLQATLTVTANTPDAVVSIENDKGSWTPDTGKAQKLDAGKYTVRVEAPGHQPHGESVVLKVKEAKTLTVTLKSAAPTLF